LNNIDTCINTLLYIKKNQK